MLENPIKHARRSLHWTQQDLASHAQVSLQTVVQTEAGLYMKPPPRLLTPLTATLADGTTAQALSDAYQRHQQAIRQQNGALLTPQNEQTWDDYVENRGGLYNLCKLLQADWRLLTRYHDIRLAKGYLRDLLIDAGVENPEGVLSLD